MKRRISLIALVAFTAGAMVFTGCKKDDTTPPTITVTGGDQTVSLNSTYTDQGATANDDEDGDISSSVTASGVSAVNTNQTGTYTITYSVSDAAGNTASATRTVTVVNDADFLAGSYSGTYNCQASGSSTFTSTVSASGTTNNAITIGNFGGLGSSVMINATRSGSSLTIPLQSVGANGSIQSASGTITSSTTPVAFTTTYSYNDGTSSELCNDTYTHQ